MKHPTLEEVEAADRFTLCKWHRFLPTSTTDEQIKIANRIFKRWKEAGGFTPAISKALGWNKQ